MAQEKPASEQTPDFITRKEFTDWQATQKKPEPEHEPEPDETYVPAWAKQLTEKVDAMGKTPPPQQNEQTPPNTQVTKVEPPPPVVEPKKDFWPKAWPKIL